MYTYIYVYIYINNNTPPVFGGKNTSIEVLKRVVLELRTRHQ
jgi:hypothetical protein